MTPRKTRKPIQLPMIARQVRAAIYLRVSTTDQATEGNGLEAQRHGTMAAAVVKGWTPVCEFEDAGISGSLGEADRPGLAALLAAVEAGEVNAVIVSALDRLGRSTSKTIELVKRLQAAGCELISCRESLDTATPAGWFMLTVFAALAQMERDVIVGRTTAGRNVRGSRDGERGGRLPLGYRRIFRDGKAVGVEVDQEGAAVVRRILGMRDAGMTLRGVADTLNADGVPGGRGGSWGPSAVKLVCENRDSYAGGTRGASGVHWPAVLAQ